MKKFIFIFILLFLVPVNSVSYAQGALADSPIPVQRVDYELPYPGLLPDSPLYFLKISRDRLIEFMIGDPIKKSEFFILQSDKRLNAAFYVFKKKGKNEMISSSISKSNDYLEKALIKANEAKREGRDTTFLFEKIVTTAKQHEQAIKDLGEKNPKDTRGNFFKWAEKTVFLQNQALQK